MEKSRMKPAAVELEQPKEKLQVVPKPVAREVGHHPEHVHATLARNYQCASETASRTCLQADRNMDIARNMDDHSVKKGRPLHERFAGMLG